MSGDPLAQVSKDDLVLATLAALGGEDTDVNERDLFLACWHAFPATMRWVDTALPNPDTFTASLRRLDQRGYIVRLGKQKRQKGRGRKAATRRKSGLEAPGRTGAVKARIAEGGLEAAHLDPAVVDAVASLLPDRSGSSSLSDAAAIAICVGLRERGGRELDEGGLVELAFHRFPDHFAYAERPEFPDLERIRSGVAVAREQGLLGEGFELTERGRAAADDGVPRGDIGLESSHVPARGELRIAARIEKSASYRNYVSSGTLATSKPDELYRALRMPPTTDPRPVAEALRSRLRGLRRIDKGEVGTYLLAIAARHNPEVAALIRQDEEQEKQAEVGLE